MKVMPDQFQVSPLSARFDADPDASLDVADITNSLRSLMVRKMGIVRDQAGLLEAERAVSFWCHYVLGREFEAQAG